MELVNFVIIVNKSDENSFDPTPKLKSSPIPILFVPFNDKDQNCFNCGDKYTFTFFYLQKYCKRCLSRYVSNITDNNTYLDMCIHTVNLECSRHEMIRDEELLIQSVRDWCEYCSEISFFKQIFSNHYIYETKNKLLFESEKYCKLCGKSVYQQSHPCLNFRVCSNCYQISSGWVESNLTKKYIPILYLPWWDTHDLCISCSSNLKFTSDCQKYCTRCYIVYTGCRYCLTTNIIFGFTNKSRCKKCNRFIVINIDSMDVILYDLMFNLYSNYHSQLAEVINDVKRIENPTDIYTRLIGKKHNVNPEDTILKLKSSSSIPILFVSWNNNDQKCFHCEEKYTQTL